MFGSSRRPTEDAEKPFRYDPAKHRPPPAENQAPRPTRFQAGMPNLASHLPALNGVTRPMLPPAELARRHVPDLADVLKEVGRAESTAFNAAREWMSAYNGEGFKDALISDGEWVEPWIQKGEDPPDDDGPLFTHMVSGIPQAFAHAWHAQAAVDFADHRAREYGASDVVRKPLDELTDDLALKIQDHLERARDHKSRGAYDQAIDVCLSWSEAGALYEWSVDTSKAFRNRSPRSLPRHLAMLDFEAATAVGLNPAVVPVEVLEDPDAPPSKMFPSERPQAPFQVVGGEPQFGSQGPPSRVQRWRQRGKGE